MNLKNTTKKYLYEFCKKHDAKVTSSTKKAELLVIAKCCMKQYNKSIQEHKMIIHQLNAHKERINKYNAMIKKTQGIVKRVQKGGGIGNVQGKVLDICMQNWMQNNPQMFTLLLEDIFRKVINYQETNAEKSIEKKIENMREVLKEEFENLKVMKERIERKNSQFALIRKFRRQSTLMIGRIEDDLERMLKVKAIKPDASRILSLEMYQDVQQIVDEFFYSCIERTKTYTNRQFTDSDFVAFIHSGSAKYKDWSIRNVIISPKKEKLKEYFDIDLLPSVQERIGRIRNVRIDFYNLAQHIINNELLTMEAKNTIIEYNFFLVTRTDNFKIYAITDKGQTYICFPGIEDLYGYNLPSVKKMQNGNGSHQAHSSNNELTFAEAIEILKDKKREDQFPILEIFGTVDTSYIEQKVKNNQINLFDKISLDTTYIVNRAGHGGNRVVGYAQHPHYILPDAGDSILESIFFLRYQAISTTQQGWSQKYNIYVAFTSDDLMRLECFDPQEIDLGQQKSNAHQFFKYDYYMNKPLNQFPTASQYIFEFLKRQDVVTLDNGIYPDLFNLDNTNGYIVKGIIPHDYLDNFFSDEVHGNLKERYFNEFEIGKDIFIGFVY